VEMALKLSDVIRRRTELGAAGLPDTDCIKTCADLMASELGWSEARKREEIEDVLTDSPLTATRFAKS
jgi:glycerol-3-phosphate dehydrogenase